jgi:hypothetical protein
VYLLKQMNDEWMYGRNKRGCEGIFPISYVEVRVPLQQVEPDSGTASRSASTSPAVETYHIRALYSFNAETEEDLTIKVMRMTSKIDNKRETEALWAVFSFLLSKLLLIILFISRKTKSSTSCMKSTPNGFTVRICTANTVNFHQTSSNMFLKICL